MKLVIATPLYPPEIGGPATYARILEEGLPARGVEVELVKFGDVRRLPKFIRHYVYYRRVLRAARRADLVLVLDPVSVGLPAMYAARKAGKPFVVKIVGDYAWEQGQQRFGVAEPLDDFVKTRQHSFFVRILQRIQTRVARRATRIIVPSQYLKRIVSAWGIPEAKTEVIYNAVSLEDMGDVPESFRKLQRPLVVSVGRLVPWKGFEGLVEAIADINATHEGSQTSLTVVGDGPARAELERHAHEKLGSSCLLTGPLSRADTLAVMKSADIFVLNSSYEGLSHVLIEALALGKPILATAVGGNPEVITDGETGLLVPAGDQVALSHALAMLLGNGPLRLRLSVNAKIAAQRFSSETMLDRTSDTLFKLGHPMSKFS